MGDLEGHIIWYTPEEAQDKLLERTSAGKNMEELGEPNFEPLPDSADAYESLTAAEPRRYVAKYLDETQTHLDGLWVLGIAGFTEEDLIQLGPSLAREATYRDDAVFHILDKRRQDVASYLQRFVMVKKHHMLQYGLASQAGSINLQKIQDRKTAEAQKIIQPLVEEDQFEDLLLASDMQRRVLRALYYILTEPSGSAYRFLGRLNRQATETGKLTVEELIARTYNFTHSQYEKHSRANPTSFESEENMVRLFEQGRLSRLRYLGQTVLVSGLGIITAGEYKDS
jgi:hypothetical protein